LGTNVLEIRALLRQPVYVSDNGLSEADAIRLHLVAPIIDLAKPGLYVEMLAGFIKVPDDTGTQVHLLIAAPATLPAHRFPLVSIHVSVPAEAVLSKDRQVDERSRARCQSHSEPCILTLQ
jgi:hypothetical protein